MAVTPPPVNADSRAMLHTVARLHYVSDMSQVDIARHLGLSAATISRLLRRARQEGIVRIEVRDIHAPDALGADLAARLGLRHVRLADAPAGADPGALAAPLSGLLQDLAPPPGAVMMIGWGRAMRAVIAAGLPPLPGVVVVPATGGLQQHAPHFQINEFARLAAAAMGGRPAFVHAPNLPAAGLRAGLLADPAIAETTALWDRVDVALVGVGLPPVAAPPEDSVATSGELHIAGVAGDVVRHYFDAAGRLIPWQGEERMIAASAAQLRGAGLSVGIAKGEDKARAILGAARAGLISALVTDVTTAQALADLLDSGAA